MMVGRIAVGGLQGWYDKTALLHYTKISNLLAFKIGALFPFFFVVCSHACPILDFDSIASAPAANIPALVIIVL